MYAILIFLLAISKKSFAQEIRQNDIDVIDESRDEIDTPIKIGDKDNIFLFDIAVKANANIFVNQNFNLSSEIKANNIDNLTINRTNMSLEKFNNGMFQIETRLNIFLYDGMVITFPFRVSHFLSYNKNAVDNMKKKVDLILDRVFDTEAGFWIDWNATQNLVIGFRGGLDDKNGYAFKISNKLYKKSYESINNITFSAGFNLTEWSVLGFVEYIKKFAYLDIEPELRIMISSGSPSSDINSYSDNLFTVYLLFPIKTDFKLNIVKFKEKLEFSVKKSFNSVSDIKNKFFGSDAGYLLSAKNTFQVEIPLESAIIKLPFKIDASSRIDSKIAELGINQIKFNITPNIEYSKIIIENMELIVDAQMKYDFLSMTFGNNFSYNFNTNPTITVGIGFKYNKES
jgi:hypothetical protein